MEHAACRRRWYQWGRSLACLVLCITCLGCQREDAHSAPEALREMHLVDQDAELLDKDLFLKRILVMNFMFTSCPDACPRLTRVLGKARDLLPGALQTRVRFLSVSVDPEHDRPQALKDFARRHRADLPEWRFARLEDGQLSELSRRLAVFEPGSAKAPSAHSLAIYLFDQKGRPVQRYDGGTIDPAHLAQEITALAAFEQGSKP